MKKNILFSILEKKKFGSMVFPMRCNVKMKKKYRDRAQRKKKFLAFKIAGKK